MRGRFIFSGKTYPTGLTTVGTVCHDQSMTNTNCTGELVSAVITNGTETHYHNGTECPGHAPATEYVSKRFGRNGSAIHLAYANGNTPKCGAYFRPGSGVTVTEPATCRNCLA